MYKIDIPDISTKVNDYLTSNNFMKKVGELMQSYLTHSPWEYKYLGENSITVVVEPDSVTYRFLSKYSKKDNLRKLLSGELTEQLEIIKDVYEGIPDDLHPVSSHKEAFNPIRNRIIDYRKSDTDYVTKVHDDFNSIIRYIFEDIIYEGKGKVDNPHINKDLFVKNLGLRVCPYCGRSYIYGLSATRDGKGVIVKPQIDHFFPKSVYPFLAANFFNLIPCCQTCNMKPAKGEQNTLKKTPDGELKIQHPYNFDDKAITFGYNLKSSMIFKPDETPIVVDYHGNKVLQDGYNDFFFIDEFYKRHNVEANDIYVKLESWYQHGSKKAYKGVGLPNEVLDQLPLLLFGYQFNSEEASKRVLYKFNHDIYNQMLSDFQRGKLT